MSGSEMLLPDWEGRVTSGIVPALTWGAPSPLIPDSIRDAAAVVLLVLDSLGWELLQARPALAPILCSMEGGAATTVAPSTTASALTSISTGVPPGEHGIVGYRFPAGGSVLNALRWTTPAGDHRTVVPPSTVQVAPPFAGGAWSVVSDGQFATSAFTEAHLGSGPYLGYMHPSSIVPIVRQLIDDGAERVYAYYDGLDHIAHIHGPSSPHFDEELAFCDWLVGRLLEALPSGSALVITADHGHIDAPTLLPLADEVVALTANRSGEARFRWLHALPGRDADLLAAAGEAHRDVAWVRHRDELIEERWFGPVVTEAARSRLGDVALIAHEPIGFSDPDERRSELLVGRHGSVTPAEMLVPVLTART